MSIVIAILLSLTSFTLPHQTALADEPDPYYIVIQVFPWEGPVGPGIYATVTLATLLPEADVRFEIVLSRSLAYFGTGECLGACVNAAHLEYSNNITGRLVKNPDSSLNSAEVRFYAYLNPTVPSGSYLTVSAQVSDYSARASFVIGASETVTATSYDTNAQIASDGTSAAALSASPSVLNLPRRHRSTIEIHTSASFPGSLSIVLPRGLMEIPNSGCVDPSSMTIPELPLCQTRSVVAQSGATTVMVSLPRGDNTYVLNIFNSSLEPGQNEIRYRFNVDNEQTQFDNTIVNTD